MPLRNFALPTKRNALCDGVGNRQGNREQIKAMYIRLCQIIMIKFDRNLEERKIQIVLDQQELEEAFRNVLSELLDEREEKTKDARISRKEASKRLGKDVTTLIRWEKAHYITPIYIGKSVYYSERQIKDIEEGRI